MKLAATSRNDTRAVALLVAGINRLWTAFSTDATHLTVDCDDRFVARQNCVKVNTELKIVLPPPRGESQFAPETMVLQSEEPAFLTNALVRAVVAGTSH